MIQHNIWRAVAMLALVPLMACDGEQMLPVPPTGDGGYTDVDGRVVIETDGRVGNAQDGMPATPDDRDARPGQGNDSRPDAATSDARTSVDGSSDHMMSPMECNLLTQDCAPPQGCYPFGRGGSRCLERGTLGTLGQCIEHNQCDRGLMCRSDQNDVRVCAELCDRSLTCGGRLTCNALTGYDAVGFCPP